MKNLAKTFFVILVGSALAIFPLYIYMRYFSNIPCPDCRYIGSGFDGGFVIGVVAVIPTAIEFFICFLIAVRNREKINQYILGAVASGYAVLSSFLGERIDEFVAHNFSYSWEGGSGYFWPLSLLAMIGIGILLNLVVFRRDLFRKK